MYPSKTYTVVVADRAQALLYETPRMGGRLQRIATLGNPHGHGHERDLGASAPGRAFNRSAGVHQTMGQRTSLRAQATEKFARAITRTLLQSPQAAS